MTFGMPSYIHSDRGTAFLSTEVQSFLHSQGIATSRTTAYNPQGNGQVEKLNSTLWKTILLALKTNKLEVKNWQEVLNQSLHAIRSLLCTATNCTPHERMFVHQRRSSNGASIPTWLTNSKKVLMKKFNRVNKYQPLVEEVELLHSNPDFSYVKTSDGRETTVSNRHLAPIDEEEDTHLEQNSVTGSQSQSDTNNEQSDLDINDPQLDAQIMPVQTEDHSPGRQSSLQVEHEAPIVEQQGEQQTIRRSNRSRGPPKYLNDYTTD